MFETVVWNVVIMGSLRLACYLVSWLFSESFVFCSTIYGSDIWQEVSVTCVARVGLMHIGVFILLLLSGERNFGVRLNKPYSVRVPMDIPVFTGSHADFLIIVSSVNLEFVN